jgi:hypothetical protein
MDPVWKDLIAALTPALVGLLVAYTAYIHYRIEQGQKASQANDRSIMDNQKTISKQIEDKPT